MIYTLQDDVKKKYIYPTIRAGSEQMYDVDHLRFMLGIIFLFAEI